MKKYTFKLKQFTFQRVEMEQNYDQYETAQTVNFKESKSIPNLLPTQTKIMKQSNIQQKQTFSQKNNHTQFLEGLSTTSELERFKVLIEKEIEVIPIQLDREMKNLDFQQKKQRIIFYFPQTKSFIKSLKEQKIDKIIDMIIERAQIKKYDSRSRLQIQNVKKEQRIKICLDFLPLMKKEIQTMSYEELQKLYLEVLSQKRRKKIYRFSHKDKHPFQIKIQNRNTLQPKINIEELLNNLKQRQPTLRSVIKDVEQKLITKYKEIQKNLIQMQKAYRQKRKGQQQQHKQLIAFENHGPNYLQQMNLQNGFFKTVDETNEQQVIFYYHHVEKRTYQEMIASNSQKDKNGEVIYDQQQDCSCQRKPKATKRCISQNSKINDK